MDGSQKKRNVLWHIRSYLGRRDMQEPWWQNKACSTLLCAHHGWEHSWEEREQDPCELTFLFMIFLNHKFHFSFCFADNTGARLAKPSPKGPKEFGWLQNCLGKDCSHSEERMVVITTIIIKERPTDSSLRCWVDITWVKCACSTGTWLHQHHNPRNWT